MRRWIILGAAWISLGSVAFAQNPNPNLIGPGGAPYAWTNDTATRDDWGRCAQRDHRDAERALRSCGRIIGTRHGADITAAAHYFRGLLYEMLRDQRAGADFEEAHRWFTIVISSERRNPDAYANRAAVLYRLQRFDEALADYDTAIEVATGSDGGPNMRVRSDAAGLRSGRLAGYHHRRGSTFFRMGDWQRAIAAFDEAATISPDAGYLHSARCESLTAAADFAAAEAACAQATQLSESSSSSHFSMGYLRFMRGDYDGAAHDFYQALQKDPSNFLALYGLGVTALRSNRQEGEAMIARAREDLPEDAIAYYAAAGLRV